MISPPASAFNTLRSASLFRRSCYICLCINTRHCPTDPTHTRQTIQPIIRGAVVAERSACSPPTKANRFQCLTGSLPGFRMWESRRTMSLVGWFSRGSPVSPPLHYGAAPYSPQSPSCALRTSLLRAPKISHPRPGSSFAVDRPIMNAAKYRVVPGEVWTNRMMVFNLNMQSEVPHGAERAVRLETYFVTLPRRVSLTQAAVTERLYCLFPTEANRVRFQAGLLPDFRMWESFRTMTVVDGFSRGSPVSPHPCIPVLLHYPLISPSSALKTSLPAEIRDFNDQQARLYSLMYKYADINCTLVVYCQRGRRRLSRCSPGGVKHHVDQSYLRCLFNGCCPSVTPHLTVRDGLLYPCKSAFGAESSRACLINSDPIAKVLAERRKHCTPVQSVALSGDGALLARISVAPIAHALLRLKRGKKSPDWNGCEEFSKPTLHAVSQDRTTYLRAQWRGKVKLSTNQLALNSAENQNTGNSLETGEGWPVRTRQREGNTGVIDLGTRKVIPSAEERRSGNWEN
ncbi:hypothetical protein PR048_012175 [Dryococelus australis]|uniref:Uncharacterized protein n=1 Tax=Dryococelus australis TaxID=614101 RepID=A0ABQ9HPA3_9NEOP|nr:hypothetical protein PR048_012175 [Dryococelus australis]